jgi:hypothetical protein
MTADARLPVDCANEVCQIVLTYVLSAHRWDTWLCVWRGRRTTALVSVASCVGPAASNMLRDVLVDIDLNVHTFRRNSWFLPNSTCSRRYKASLPVSYTTTGHSRRRRCADARLRPRWPFLVIPSRSGNPSSLAHEKVQVATGRWRTQVLGTPLWRPMESYRSARCSRCSCSSLLAVPATITPQLFHG